MTSLEGIFGSSQLEEGVGYDTWNYACIFVYQEVVHSEFSYADGNDLYITMLKMSHLTTS